MERRGFIKNLGAGFIGLTTLKVSSKQDKDTITEELTPEEKKLVEQHRQSKKQGPDIQIPASGVASVSFYYYSDTSLATGSGTIIDWKRAPIMSWPITTT